MSYILGALKAGNTMCKNVHEACVEYSFCCIKHTHTHTHQHTRTHIPVHGAGRSSEVQRSLMVRWVVGSILHGVDPLSYFSFQPVLHDWCNKERGMCYPVCGMMHIKEPLLLIGKSSPCRGSGFPLSLSEWPLAVLSTLFSECPLC